MNYHEVKYLSREFRKNQTPSEKQLWNKIRDRQLDGFKFLRQHPIVYDRNGNDLNIFIPDFYCARARLAVEIDGGIHFNKKDHDKWREEILVAMGITVMRFQNDELIEIETILQKIRKKLKPAQTPFP